MKIRYKATLAYNGQNYHGWAKQPKQQTIQGILEDIIFHTFKQRIVVFGSGRTDAGVNALGQIIHFDLDNINIKTNQLKDVLNKALPYDIRILNIKKIDNKFNARFSAKNKTYVYSINVGKVNPIESSYIYQYNKPIDLTQIREISRMFLGKKNFLSFSTDARNGDSVIKTINYITISKDQDIIKISINGDGFLRSMVRMIVGTLIAFNENKINKQEIQSLFVNPSKGKAMFKAPACGLCLVKVNY